MESRPKGDVENRVAGQTVFPIDQGGDTLAVRKNVVIAQVAVQEHRLYLVEQAIERVKSGQNPAAFFGTDGVAGDAELKVLFQIQKYILAPAFQDAPAQAWF